MFSENVFVLSLWMCALVLIYVWSVRTKLLTTHTSASYATAAPVSSVSKQSLEVKKITLVRNEVERVKHLMLNKGNKFLLKQECDRVCTAKNGPISKLQYHHKKD